MTQSHTLTQAYSATRPGRTSVPARTQSLIYQTINIALQYPFGSHNRRCVQRRESCGLQVSIAILLLWSSRNQIKRLSNKTGKKKSLNHLTCKGLSDRPWVVPGKNASEWSVKRFADASLQVKPLPVFRYIQPDSHKTKVNADSNILAE